MGVQLNIKDAATVRLARDLADASGQSVTETIRGALEREMAAREVDLARRKAELFAAVADFQKVMPPDWKTMTSKEMMDAIYDEDGLPK